MKSMRVLVVAALLSAPSLALADTYQLWLEQFDEGREITVCKYRSGLGNDEVAEYAGRYLCPRVACQIPAPEDPALRDDCPVTEARAGSACRPAPGQVVTVGA